MLDVAVNQRSEVCAALFVDFDNIYLGLRKLDGRAAEAFASSPTRWLTWLEEGLDSDAGTRRRFLIKNVYLNPVAFGSYRGVYTRTGFRAVDCPPLTGQGKNSADIYMVLDIIDALQNSFHYDEFVIASADADFTPVLHRLRAQGRRTTLLTAGLSAAAYRAVSDSFVTPEVLADAALGEVDAITEEDVTMSLLVQPSFNARDSATGPGKLRTEKDVEAVRSAVRQAVASAERPIVSAAAAHAALRVDPSLKATDWWGSGSFRAFLALYVEDLTYEGNPTPGYVYDPRRHSTRDLPVAERTDLDSLLQRVCVVTGAPALTSDRYATLFVALAEELAAAPFDRTETAKRVRDRTDLAGNSVGRNAVNFALQGLVYSGADFSAGVSARSLAEGYLSNLKALCANARMSLSAADEKALDGWILRSLPPESVHDR